MLCVGSQLGTFSVETQPWKGWSVILLHVRSTSLLSLLLPLHLLLRLFLLLLFRDATRHFVQERQLPARTHFNLRPHNSLASVHAACLSAPWRAA